MRLDGNGIPILSRTEIEVRTERLLDAFEPRCLTEPRATPLAAIADRLRTKHGAKFVFRADLGVRKGRQIRGCFDIQSRTIFIDKSLPEREPRFNFTLAHEIGHFVMHRNVDPIVLRGTTKRIEDNDRDLILDQLQSDNPRSWMEWQANKFASSLLLPRATVLNAVITKQKELGVTRSLGKIYLDRQAGNYRDFKELLDNLLFIYQASYAAIRIRLRELNILREAHLDPAAPPSGPEPIQTSLARAIGEWLPKIDKASKRRTNA